MIKESDVKRMPLNQKLRIMEIIWDDLCQHSEAVESPDWHRKELEATEARRQAGLEELMDWAEAKKTLLNR
jgi:hypothetical protein